MAKGNTIKVKGQIIYIYRYIKKSLEKYTLKCKLLNFLEIR